MQLSTHIKICLLALLCASFSHVFADQKGAYQSHSSKALVLDRLADSELAKQTNDGIEKAVHILESVIADVSFKRLSLEMQLPIFLKLAHAYELQNSFKAAEQLLLELINTPHFEPFLIPLKVQLGKSYVLQNRAPDAEFELKKLLKISPKTLPLQDRNEIISLILRLDAFYEKLLQNGQSAFEKKQFLQSALCYSQLLDAVKHNHFPRQVSRQASKQMKEQLIAKLKLRLGISYFREAEFEKAATILNEQNFAKKDKSLQVIFRTSLFYLALSLKNQNRHEEAHLAFCDYLAQDADLQKLPFAEYALLYASYAAFQTKNLSQSKLYIDELLRYTKNKNIELLAKLQEAKILIASNELQAAMTELDELEKYGPVRKQAFYLKGLLALRQNDLEAAVVHLEKSATSLLQSEWEKDALYTLGTTYNKLATGNVTKNGISAHIAYLERAEACFLKLASLSQKENIVLGLAENYFVRFYFFSEIPKEKIVSFIEENKPYLSIDGQLECELILAQIESSFEEREVHFSRCTSQEFAHSKLFAKAHFLKAVNEIQNAKCAPISLAPLLFDEALATLRTAKDNGYDPVQIAKTLLSFPHKTYVQEACTLLESLQDTESDEEVQYLIAISYLTLDKEKAKGKAEQFFTRFAKSPKKAKLAHELAKLLLSQKLPQEALPLLLSHLLDFRDYPERAEILHLSAYTHDMLQSDPEKAKALRKELIASYPHSPFASDAAFRQFSEKEYQLATPHAIFHLENMLTLYPESAYTIAATFYVGNFYKQESQKQKESEKELQFAKEAIAKFAAVDQLYEKLKSKNLIEEEQKNYFFLLQVEALLLQGSFTHLAELDRNCSQRALLKLNGMLEEYLVAPKKENRPQNTHLIKIYQEASYLLATTYEKQQNEHLCRKQLESLIHWLNKNEIKSKFLISAYLDLAKLELKMGRYSSALDFFEKAQNAAEFDGMQKELQLEIKIAKSDCYRQMSRLDLAMTLLSEVINDDAASSLRIKAMLLRAEIYRIQHRNDLAIKQLEAASSKGGEWGQKAKLRLEELRLN